MLTSILNKSDDEVAESDLVEQFQALSVRRPHRRASISQPTLSQDDSVLNTSSTHSDPMITVLGDFHKAVFLFAEVRDFQLLWQSTSPSELVSKLNPIYFGFENIISHYGYPVGIRTIKWESDCLMLCGSSDTLAESNEQAYSQVKAMLTIASAFTQFLYSYNNDLTGKSIDFKFGIHIGPATKTLVRFKGSEKQEFKLTDWFGESVNQASRMKSSSRTNQAQVTEVIYDLAKKDFTFTGSRPRPIKTYGEVLTRFLFGPIDRSPQKKSLRQSSATAINCPPQRQSRAYRSCSSNQQTTRSSSGDISKSRPSLTQDDSVAQYTSLHRTLLMSPQADPMIKILGEYNHAVFLFADIKGFTALSQKISSRELVKKLEPIYTAFENIIEHHGKAAGIKIVKWVGDCIILCACSDLPDETDVITQNHVNAMVYIGHLLSQFMFAHNKSCDDVTFDFRFGINIGKATKMRIRIKEPDGTVRETIDWCGEGVSNASGMEASSHPNQVQVSEEIFNIAKGNFIFTEPHVRELHQGEVSQEITTCFLYSPSKKFLKGQTENHHPQATNSSSSATLSRKLLGSSRSASANK